METSNIKKYRLRVKYCKVGPLCFLSHLEVLTSIQNTIRRAKLPFAVSCGYSPHMLISFGPALSLGLQSLSEYFDIVLTDYVNPDMALKQLKTASCNFLFPISCEYVENKAKSIDTTFNSYSYMAVLDTNAGRGQLVSPDKFNKENGFSASAQDDNLNNSVFSRDDISIPNEITFVKKDKKKTIITSDVLTDKVDIISVNNALEILSSATSLNIDDLKHLMLFDSIEVSVMLFNLKTNLGNSIKASVFVENILKESAIDLDFLSTIIKF